MIKIKEDLLSYDKNIKTITISKNKKDIFVQGLYGGKTKTAISKYYIINTDGVIIGSLYKTDYVGDSDILKWLEDNNYIDNALKYSGSTTGNIFSVYTKGSYGEDIVLQLKKVTNESKPLKEENIVKDISEYDINVHRDNTKHYDRFYAVVQNPFVTYYDTEVLYGGSEDIVRRKAYRQIIK